MSDIFTLANGTAYYVITHYKCEIYSEVTEMVIHTVESGDTLYNIAKRYGADMELIARDNEIEEPYPLTVGQTLVIRSPRSVHKVGDGENIYSLAQRYGVTVNSLWRKNPHLSGGTALREGEQIVIADEAPKYEGEIAVNAYVYPSVDRKILRKTLPYLTYLTIFSYGIEDSGELTDMDDEAVIDLAREYGVSPIMSVSNLTPDGFYSSELAERVLGDKDIQNTLIGEIVRNVAEKRYGGVSVDFEYIPEELSEEYAEFVSRLNEKLGSGGNPVFTALSPRSDADDGGILGAGHDYKALGNMADALMLQSYGWGHMYSAPSAIAPANKVSETLDYAIRMAEPKKLFLGMPNYGYDWRLPYTAGNSRAEGLGSREAQTLAGEKLAAIEYDEVARSPFFRYYDKAGEGAAEHEVWFSDARSAQHTLSMANERGVGGISVWNAMKYFPQLWLLLDGSWNIKKAFK